MIQTKKMKVVLAVPVAAVALMTACSTPKDVTYLQDIQSNVLVATQQVKEIKLQPGDKLDIVVHSRDKDLADMFNQADTRSAGNTYSYYTVDAGGQIDMPVLGMLSVAGMTRMEVAELIKYRLLSAKLVRDATVTVDYADMGYYVMGEVGRPGRIDIDRDKITLLEGLAMAGDLNITGKRDNILVLRTEEGRQTPYRVDITKTGDLYASPVYYLRQNDLIYVEPNKMRKNQSALNANTLQTPSFWMSTASFLLSIILLIVR